jgi:hypothetical protein
MEDAMTMRALVGVGVVVSGLGMAACTLASPTYITSSEDPVTGDPDAAAPPPASGGASSGGNAPSGAPATCGADDFTKPDLSTLTACGGGKGHCYDKNKVSIAGILVACPDASKVCVPDEVLLADGQPLAKCTSLIGPGGCVAADLIPMIAAGGGSVLKQDVCAAGLTCVPCTNPQDNNAPTPFCQPIGVHSKDCSASGGGAGGDGGAPAPLPACCTTNGKSNGVCLSETAIPEAQRSQAKADTCAAGNKCVPAALVNGKPVTCSAGFLGAGVCMDQCFNDMMKIAGQIGFLDSKGCGTTELCIPCSMATQGGAPVPGCT